MMENNKLTIKDDYFKILRILASDIFQLKIVKVILSAVFLVHLCTTVITVRSLLLKILKLHEFVTYAPVFFGSFYGMLAIWVLLFRDKLVADLLDEFRVLPLESVKEEVQLRLKREIKIITVFVLLNFMIALCASALYCTPLYGDIETFYALRFFEDHFPNYKKFLSVVYRGTFPVFVYVMVVHVYQVIYSTQHARVQIIISAEYIKNVAHNEGVISEVDLFYSNNYQELVQKGLKRAIFRHQEFMAILRLKKKQMSNLIVGFSLCGCILGISFAFAALAGKFYREHLIRIALASITATSAFGAVILAGQSIENEGDVTLTRVIEMNWYNFNQRNKRSYLIFLHNMMQPWKIEFSEQYSINYELGLAIVKGIYSIISVVANMHFDN